MPRSPPTPRRPLQVSSASEPPLGPVPTTPYAPNSIMGVNIQACTMPALSRTAMFLARIDRLRALREFLERFCADAGLGGDQCLRLNLVLEELFTNTVRHGHRGDSASTPRAVRAFGGSAARGPPGAQPGPSFTGLLPRL